MAKRKIKTPLCEMCGDVTGRRARHLQPPHYLDKRMSYACIPVQSIFCSFRCATAWALVNFYEMNPTAHWCPEQQKWTFEDHCEFCDPPSEKDE